MSPSLVVTALVLASLTAGCRTGRNYGSPEGPGYAGWIRGGPDCPVPSGDTLRIVTYNVQYGIRVREAGDALAALPELRCADLVLLQEMDEVGTIRIAHRLGMRYVYYPAVHHYRHRRDFGNAVLSRWPVLEHSKIILPHLSLLTRTQRTATAVTVEVDGALLRVYSTHLGMLLEVSGDSRRAQLATIAEDAERFDRVIIGGDMNSGDVGRLVREAGFDWPTEEGPPTVLRYRWDHVFLKGFSDNARAGTVTALDDVSDHRPVWVTVPWEDS